MKWREKIDWISYKIWLTVYKLQRHFAICRLTYVDSINCHPKIKEIEYVLLPENIKKKYKCIDKRMSLYIDRHTNKSK